MLAGKGLLAQEALNHARQLLAGNRQHIYSFIIGEAFGKIAIQHYRSQIIAADSTGAHQHNINTKALLQRIRYQAAKRSFLNSGRMLQLAGKAGNQSAVLFICQILVVHNEVFQALITRAMGFIDRHSRPGIGIHRIQVGIYHDIKTTDLVRACSGLYNKNIINLYRMLQKGMRMTADNNVNTPSGIKHCCQLFILFKADMRKNNREININRIICITNTADFLRRLADIYKGADYLIHLRLRQYVLGNDADEENLHTIDMRDIKRLEKTLIIRADMKVRIDNREIGALFDKQQMRQTVIYLMVTNGHNVRTKQIHNLNGRYALVFRINYGATEHISGNAVNNILFFCSYLIDIAGKHGYAADELIINSFSQEITMQVIGM